MDKDEFAQELLKGNVEYQPMNEAVDETWKYVVPIGIGIGKIFNRGLNAFNEIKPYLGDIWAGRNLIFHKPFDLMDSEEYNTFGKLGKDFYKSYLHNQNAHHKQIGDIGFPNSQAGKPDYRYMENYPLTRYKIEKNNDYFYEPLNKKRTDAEGFYNLIDGDVLFQFRKNKNNGMIDFYNIKPKK